MRKFVFYTALAFTTALFLWLCGLTWFLTVLPSHSVKAESPKDAIVVLTGGSLRVDNGLELLAAGMGKKLFISGVPKDVTLKDVYKNKPQEKYLSYFTGDFYVTLGHEAVSTETNAIETADWMKRQNFKSMYLVTAYYHMPRSQIELGQAMPDIEIIPYPVFPEKQGQGFWWQSRESRTLILSEYHKTLASLLKSLLLKS